MTDAEQRWFDGGFQLGLKMCELIASGYVITSYPEVKDLTDLELTLTALDAKIKGHDNDDHQRHTQV